MSKESVILMMTMMMMVMKMMMMSENFLVAYRKSFYSIRAEYKLIFFKSASGKCKKKNPLKCLV